MTKSLLTICISFYALVSFGQGSGAAFQNHADTLHYRKVYYFGGTGLAFPLGKTGRTMSTRPFTSSMGLDISLKNPKYFLLPTLFTLAFTSDQLIEDSDYNRMIENARSSIFALMLAGGIRRQYDKLNTYIFAGPAFCLDVEPRVQDLGNGVARMENLYAFSPAVKLGVGSDYKFRGFFFCAEMNYMYHSRNIQNTPINTLTVTLGVKSDITNFRNRVVDVLNSGRR